MDTPSLSPGVKRTHDGNPVSSELTPDSTKMHTLPVDFPSYQRAASPALSTASSSLSELSTMSSSAPQQPLADGSAPPAKKRKVTFIEREAEKAARKRGKDEKARIKAEEKQQKEEEKRVKDEEKRRLAEEKEESRRLKEVEKAEEKAIKDAEREAKKRAKDEKDAAKEAEKQRLEAEKQKKEAEKLKKERAQMRIGNFFGRPAPASTPPSTPDDVSSGVSSRRSSVASIDMIPPILDSKQNDTQADFSNWIFPYFTPEHTDLAPHNRFISSGSANTTCIDLPTQYPSAKSQPLSQRFNRSRRRLREIVPVKTLISLIGSSKDVPIDLTDDTTNEASLLLSRSSYKILKFAEDVRPPYQGTYTRQVSPRSRRKLSRRSTVRALPDVNYDYDSEAEWEAPAEGDEDLEDDDELSDDEADVDEMVDFLDDENETSRRKLMTSDVEPVSTGLCWEGETDLAGLSLNLNAYRMDVLHDDVKFPINPYSTSHWSGIGKVTPMKAKPVETPAMQPPRLPLAQLNIPNGSPMRNAFTQIKMEVGADQKENASPQTQKSKPKAANKPLKTVPDELLPAFKAAVSGSDLNKLAIVEILKKQFPSCSKDAIKGSLDQVAMRQGKKEADKRWVLHD